MRYGQLDASGYLRAREAAERRRAREAAERRAIDTVAERDPDAIRYMNGERNREVVGSEDDR